LIIGEKRMEDDLEKKKKTYKAPALRRVRLEVRTSVLSVCMLSPIVSATASPATCTELLWQCFGVS
jgi:hypothetical protein